MSTLTKKFSFDLSDVADEILKRVDVKIIPMNQEIAEIKATLESTAKLVNSLKEN